MHVLIRVSSFLAFVVTMAFLMSASGPSALTDDCDNVLHAAGGAGCGSAPTCDDDDVVTDPASLTNPQAVITSCADDGCTFTDGELSSVSGVVVNGTSDSVIYQFDFSDSSPSLSALALYSMDDIANSSVVEGGCSDSNYPASQVFCGAGVVGQGGGGSGADDEPPLVPRVYIPDLLEKIWSKKPTMVGKNRVELIPNAGQGADSGTVCIIPAEDTCAQAKAPNIMDCLPSDNMDCKPFIVQSLAQPLTVTGDICNPVTKQFLGQCFWNKSTTTWRMFSEDEMIGCAINSGVNADNLDIVFEISAVNSKNTDINSKTQAIFSIFNPNFSHFVLGDPDPKMDLGKDCPYGPPRYVHYRDGTVFDLETLYKKGGKPSEEDMVEMFDIVESIFNVELGPKGIPQIEAATYKKIDDLLAQMGYPEDLSSDLSKVDWSKAGDSKGPPSEVTSIGTRLNTAFDVEDLQGKTLMIECLLQAGAHVFDILVQILPPLIFFDKNGNPVTFDDMIACSKGASPMVMEQFDKGDDDDDDSGGGSCQGPPYDDGCSCPDDGACKSGNCSGGKCTSGGGGSSCGDDYCTRSTEDASSCYEDCWCNGTGQNGDYCSSSSECASCSCDTGAMKCK